MNMELLTPRNIAVIIFLAFAWLWWGKRFTEKHITESVEE